MKKLLCFVLIVTGLLFLPGCLNTTEEVTIQENGSGIYQVHTDLSKMFDFLDMMKAMDTSGSLSQQKIPDNVDTTIQLRSFTDTSSKLTAEDKALLRDATLHMVMSEKEKVFKVDMRYPYQDISDVQKIIKLSQANNSLIGKALQGNSSVQNNAVDQPAVPDFMSIYDVTFKKGFLQKRVNAGKLKELESDEKFNELKQASQMMGEATINTIIHLPKPAKKAEGPNVKLSNDKKTVTVNASFSDLFDDPATLSYQIEY